MADLILSWMARGVHWTDYPQTPDGQTLTAREAVYGVGQRHLRADHYGSRYSWRAGEDPPDLSGGEAAQPAAKRAKVDK